MDFDRFSVLLLIRRHEAPPLDEKASAELQDAHMAYLASLHADGRLLAAGPAEPPSGITIVGVCLFRVGLDEARSLLEKDPAVRAGRLRLEVFPWSVPGGTISFAPSRFPRSMAEVDAP
jgi:uncharacterized protein